MNFTRAERRLMGGAGVRSVPSSIPVSTLLADHIFIHSTKNATILLSHRASILCSLHNIVVRKILRHRRDRRLQCFVCYLRHKCLCLHMYILRTNLSPHSSCFDSLPCVLKMLPTRIIRVKFRGLSYRYCYPSYYRCEHNNFSLLVIK
ncbi:uncharacterized protein [Temnothorax longispinosus]|uniref:uncharacterized protein n=1 Tax=Temnothorax longispinosus TaxID=300112 RepID=UPI003A9A47E1